MLIIEKNFTDMNLVDWRLQVSLPRKFAFSSALKMPSLQVIHLALNYLITDI
ncbi:MAG: hypothetical protein OCU18_04270 [Candidatus Syntrophoarchaeum sp.]|nr:hypothetical protein [Candidatus Syntrophoarchaeum sp.]